MLEAVHAWLLTPVGFGVTFVSSAVVAYFIWSGVVGRLEALESHVHHTANMMQRIMGSHALMAGEIHKLAADKLSDDATIEDICTQLGLCKRDVRKLTQREAG